MTRAKKQKIENHYKEPLSKSSNHLGGYSRRAGDASVDVKNKVIAAIQETGKKYQLFQKDIANLIAISKVESGFNPDAAAQGKTTSASGVFQIVDKTVEDAITRLSGKPRALGIKLGVYDRFDYRSNIEYGIAVYLDKKAKARSDDIREIYKKWHTNPKVYTPYLEQLRKDSQEYEEKLKKGLPILVSEKDSTLGVILVIEETRSGRNQQFLDRFTGEVMNREVLVAHIQAGHYPHYKIASIAGLATPVSKPDESVKNNLG